MAQNLTDEQGEACKRELQAVQPPLRAPSDCRVPVPAAVAEFKEAFHLFGE